MFIHIEPMPGLEIDNFYTKDTREIRENSGKFQIVEIPNRRTADRLFFDDLEALVYSILSIPCFQVKFLNLYKFDLLSSLC